MGRDVCISGRWEPRTTSTGSEGGREGERKITHQQVLGTECFTKIYTARVGKEGEKGYQKERRENIENEGRDTPSLFAEDNGGGVVGGGVVEFRTKGSQWQNGAKNWKHQGALNQRSQNSAGQGCLGTVKSILE